MNYLSDVITYVRRIIKSPSDAVISDNLIIDYINRFYLSDVDARIQLFDLKSTYKFQTTPGVDKYNMPLYDVQIQPPGSGADIASYPIYQGFSGPAYVNGVPVSFQTQKQAFYNTFPNVTQYNQVVGVGDGVNFSYTLQVPFLSSNLPNPNNPPFNGMLRGHVDITGINATGFNIDPPVANTTLALTQIPAVPVTSVDAAVFITTIDANGKNLIVTDSGQFLDTDVNYGLLMLPGNAPNGNSVPGPYTTTSNTVNYLTGEINVTFPVVVPAGNNISVQCYFFASGLPRAILYYNNTLTLRVPPAMQYLVELEAYLSPAAFLQTGNALPFGYMAEYLARGAARKILSDTGDIEQFMFYEPLFREQEQLVWKRSQRQFTSTRTETLYSRGMSGGFGNNNLGSMGGV